MPFILFRLKVALLTSLAIDDPNRNYATTIATRLYFGYHQESEQ